MNFISFVDRGDLSSFFKTHQSSSRFGIEKMHCTASHFLSDFVLFQSAKGLAPTTGGAFD